MVATSEIGLRVPSFEELVAGSNQLASPSALVWRIVAQADDDTTTIASLAATIAKDGVLAAKLVRLANSAAFAPAARVSSIDRAVAMMGLRSVKLLALSLSLESLLPAAGAGSPAALVVRRRSLVNALVARRFVDHRRPVLADEVFFAGLVGHLGRLVLAQQAPAVFDHLLEAGGGWVRTEDERSLLGATGDDLTAALLTGWDLPPGVVEAVRWRAADRDAPTGVRSMVEALRMGLLAEEVLCGDPRGAALIELRQRAADRSGLGPDEVDEILISTEPMVVELAELLRLQWPAGPSHDELVAKAVTQIAQLSVATAAELAENRRHAAALLAENSRLDEVSRLDRLTGLANRATLDDFLARHLAARMRRRWDDALGVLMVDLDRFKDVNDTLGHSTGDTVLRAVGALLAQVTRRDEFAARYGGDEFVLILPHTTPVELAGAAERIRREIDRLVVDTPHGPVRVTASIGGACTRSATPGDAGREMLDRADAKLYEAKRTGRDTCCLELPGI